MLHNRQRPAVADVCGKYHSAVQRSKLRCHESLPVLRRVTINGDAVSHNAVRATNAAVDIIAELLACSQPIKTWRLHAHLRKHQR